MADDEIKRYIEYLQNQLLTPGTEQFHNHSSYVDWIKTKRHRLRDVAQSLPVELQEQTCIEIEAKLLNFQPSGKYETFPPTTAFAFILNEIIEIACEIDKAPAREIVLINSTDASSTPASRTSEGPHLLFAGLGTMAFCNYWSKAFAAILTELPLIVYPQSLLTVDFDELFKKRPYLLSLPARLALYQSFHGTLLSFGEVTQPPILFNYRTEILLAMESFVIAHECGHFFFEENNPGTNASLSTTELHELEYACDIYGFHISKAWGDKKQLWLASCGIGAIVFFYVTALNNEISAIVADDSESSKSTHPTPLNRANRIIEDIAISTCLDNRDAVVGYTKGVLLIVEAVCRTVAQSVRKALKK